jgi:hypothetical protein
MTAATTSIAATTITSDVEDNMVYWNTEIVVLTFFLALRIEVCLHCTLDRHSINIIFLYQRAHNETTLLGTLLQDQPIEGSE